MVETLPAAQCQKQQPHRELETQQNNRHHGNSNQLHGPLPTVMGVGHLTYTRVGSVALRTSSMYCPAVAGDKRVEHKENATIKGGDEGGGGG